VKFSWDPNKAKTNAKNYGVRFEDAAGAFYDPLAKVEPNAGGPGRWTLLGKASAYAHDVLYVVHIDRGLDDDGEEWVHIISARVATKHERQRYEKG
jgi:uncharacterized DUF497 family protein